MNLDANGVPGFKPYLLRAFHEWCIDKNYTPLIIVDAEHNKDKLQIPRDYVVDGQIAFNLDTEAVKDLEMENDHISFDATFNGVGEHVYIPFDNVTLILADELKQGFVMREPAEEKTAKRKKTIFTEVTD